MSQTIAAIRDALALVAVGGPLTGIAAWWIFEQARKRYPLQQPPRTGLVTKVLTSLLHAPYQARATVFVLSMLITALARVVVAWLGNEGALAVADREAATFIAFFWSQLAHAGYSLARHAPKPLPTADPHGPISLGEDQPLRRRRRYESHLGSPQAPSRYSGSVFGSHVDLSEPPTWYVSVPAVATRTAPAEDRLPPVGAGVGMTPDGEPLTARADTPKA